MSAPASGERNLSALLRSMRPTLLDGDFVFVTTPAPLADTAGGVRVRAMVCEDEGVSSVILREDAQRLGLLYGEFIGAWITLEVHSALDAVGLTAVVARCLADADISCNVIAGKFHDHLLVPVARKHDAVAALEQLSRSALPDS